MTGGVTEVAMTTKWVRLGRSVGRTEMVESGIGCRVAEMKPSSSSLRMSSRRASSRERSATSQPASASTRTAGRLGPFELPPATIASLAGVLLGPLPLPLAVAGPAGAPPPVLAPALQLRHASFAHSGWRATRNEASTAFSPSSSDPLTPGIASRSGDAVFGRFCLFASRRLARRTSNASSSGMAGRRNAGRAQDARKGRRGRASAVIVADDDAERDRELLSGGSFRFEVVLRGLVARGGKA